jgi:hypothetical protein
MPLASFGFPYTPLLLLLQHMAQGTTGVPTPQKKVIHAREVIYATEVARTAAVRLCRLLPRRQPRRGRAPWLLFRMQRIRPPWLGGRPGRGCQVWRQRGPQRWPLLMGRQRASLRGLPFWCFDNPEGLNNRHLPSWHGPRVHELAIDLRLGNVVPSQDLSGAWVTVHG